MFGRACYDNFNFEPLLWLFGTAEGRDALRTLATLGGFAIASLAYWHWRRPDETKRKAETAQEIIRACRKLEAALIASRTAQIVLTVGDKTAGGITDDDLISAMKTAVESRDIEKGKEARELALDFLAFETEVAALYGNECAQEVRAMVTLSEDIERAYNLAPHFWNGFHFPDNDKRLQVLAKTLRTLGIRRCVDNQDVEDPFEIDLLILSKKLRGGLVKHLIRRPHV